MDKSPPTEYQGVELPPLPEPFVWREWTGGVAINNAGTVVGAILSAGPGRYLLQCLPVGVPTKDIFQSYVNTPQEAVPLLVSYVLLGITKETP